MGGCGKGLVVEEWRWECRELGADVQAATAAPRRQQPLDAVHRRLPNTVPPITPVLSARPTVTLRFRAAHRQGGFLVGFAVVACHACRGVGAITLVAVGWPLAASDLNVVLGAVVVFI